MIAKLIVSESEHHSDMRYATGFAATDEFIYLEPAGGTPVMAVSSLEYSRAVAEARRGVQVREAAHFSRGGIVSALLKAAEEFNIDSFEVPGDFPLALADELRGAGLHVSAYRGAFFPSREFKTHGEVEAIRRALRITESGMRRAFDMISAATIGTGGVLAVGGEALTSERLRAEIEVEFVRRGAAADATIVAGGVQSAQPHCVGYGPLYAHTPIVMDLFPRDRSTGYWGDLTRTVVKGSASSHVASAFDAVLAARDGAKQLIRRGAIPIEIHHFAHDLLAARGFPTGENSSGGYGFFHGLGHGVGLDIHEAPRLNTSSTGSLRGGEVVTVEPGVYYPDWGGVRLEDVVVVTEQGCECLTEIETFLEIS